MPSGSRNGSLPCLDVADNQPIWLDLEEAQLSQLGPRDLRVAKESAAEASHAYGYVPETRIDSHKLTIARKDVTEPDLLDLHGRGSARSFWRDRSRSRICCSVSISSATSSAGGRWVRSSGRCGLRRSRL